MNNHIKYTALAFIAICQFGFLTSGCGKTTDSNGEKPTAMTTDTIVPPEIDRIIDIIKHDSVSAFASMVNYPLERPYPLRNIDDSITMTLYYNMMMDDSLRNVITQSTHANWNSLGWRGWTLDQGQYIWVDEKVYDINYLSKAEKSMRDVLIKEELESLSPVIATGWIPVACLNSPEKGEMFRIDIKTKDSIQDGLPDVYRLSLYEPKTDLHSNPDLLLEGGIDRQGTAGIESYFFKDENGNTAEYIYDSSSDENPPVIKMVYNGKTYTFKVEKGYWRDYINKPRGH